MAEREPLSVLEDLVEHVCGQIGGPVRRATSLVDHPEDRAHVAIGATAFLAGYSVALLKVTRADATPEQVADAFTEQLRRIVLAVLRHDSMAGEDPGGP